MRFHAKKRGTTEGSIFFMEEGECSGRKGITRGASEKIFLSHARNRGTNKILN